MTQTENYELNIIETTDKIIESIPKLAENARKIDDALTNKQDKLIAGENIIIEGNKISAVGGGGNGNILTFENIAVDTTAWVEDTTYEEFGYKADIPCTGVTEDFFSSVTFDIAEAISGNYAPISLTGEGTVTIYAVEQPESTITIPSIICSKGA